MKTDELLDFIGELVDLEKRKLDNLQKYSTVPSEIKLHQIRKNNFNQIADIVREHEQIVKCGECEKFRTMWCSARHEQGTADFCSHGKRKPEVNIDKT